MRLSSAPDRAEDENPNTIFKNVFLFWKNVHSAKIQQIQTAFKENLEE